MSQKVEAEWPSAVNWIGDPAIAANWTDQAAQYGIVAVPVALLMIGGEFDLSAGVMIVSSGLLLGYLALARGMHARGDLAALIWPDVLESSARASLRSAIAAIRRTL